MCIQRSLLMIKVFLHYCILRCFVNGKWKVYFVRYTWFNFRVTKRINASSYSRMDQSKFVEDSPQKIWSDMVSLGRPYHFKIFKSWLPRILLGPFLNTLTQMWSLECCHQTAILVHSFYCYLIVFTSPCPK